MPKLRRTFKGEPSDLRAAPAGRCAAGRARREAVPLEAHVEAAAGAGRVDPLTILAEQEKTRLHDLIRLRYGRMSRTPFTFLRGSAAIMASDLAAGVRTDLQVELCGDAHLGNFRWYHAPTRDLVFDLNDFDETLPGPFEWDVKRLAASVTVAGRASGLTHEQARRATRSAMRDYRKFIAETSARNPLDLHYYRFESEGALERIGRHGKRHRKWKEAVLAKATRRNSLLALEKLTKVVKGRRMIVPDPPLIVRVDDEIAAAGARAVAECLDGYRQSLSLEHRLLFDRFALVDVARKVVGVGSVGTRCLIALFEAGDGTPLFLQLKQATSSVLEGPSRRQPVRARGPTRRRRPASDPGDQRRTARLGALARIEADARSTSTSASSGTEREDRCRGARSEAACGLCGTVRQDARLRTCPFRRCHDDSRLHRDGQVVRRRHGCLCRPLRRHHRTGSCAALRSDRRRRDRGRSRHLSGAEQRAVIRRRAPTKGYE